MQNETKEITWEASKDSLTYFREDLVDISSKKYQEVSKLSNNRDDSGVNLSFSVANNRWNTQSDICFLYCLCNTDNFDTSWQWLFKISTQWKQ